VDPAATAHQSFIDSIGLLGSYTAHGFSGEVGGWSVLASGLPVAFLNIVTPHGVSPGGVDLSRAVAMMFDADLPLSVVLREGIDDHLGATVLGLGLKPSHSSPVMIGSNVHPRSWPEELEMIDGPRAVAHHAAVVASAFDLRVELATELTPAALAADPNVDVVVGMSGGEPVVTALGLTIAGVTGVYNVATEAAYRGRGYGSAATSAVVSKAMDRGAVATSLQSSVMGLSVYEAMGYRTVATHVHFATSS
jgi:GNAT superfamily N-acetyltransferase